MRPVPGFVRNGAKHFTRQYLVIKELLREPRDMGALCPSSPALANEMARSLSPTLMKSGLCVELGAGTGPVTEALLRHGIPPERLYVVEKSPELAELLETRFPATQIRCCGAESIGSHLPSDTPVKAVVSSLPFRSLPEEISRAIISEVERILAPGGLYIQFTYALIGEMPFVPRTFRKLRSHVILYNIPPAKVEVFRKPKTRDPLQEGEILRQ